MSVGLYDCFLVIRQSPVRVLRVSISAAVVLTGNPFKVILVNRKCTEELSHINRDVAHSFVLLLCRIKQRDLTEALYSRIGRKLKHLADTHNL